MLNKMATLQCQGNTMQLHARKANYDSPLKGTQSRNFTALSNRSFSSLNSALYPATRTRNASFTQNIDASTK